MNRLIIIPIIIVIVVGGLMAWKYIPPMMEEPPKLGELPKPDLDIYTEEDIKMLEKHYTEDDVFTVTGAEKDGDFVTLQLVYGDVPDGVDFFEIPGQIFSITISEQMYEDMLYGSTIFTGYSFDVREYAIQINKNDKDILERVGGDPASSQYAQIMGGGAVFSYQNVNSNIYAGEEELSIKEETRRILEEVNNSDSLRVRHIYVPNDYDLYMAYFGTVSAPMSTPPDEGAVVTGSAVEGPLDEAEEKETSQESTTGASVSGAENTDDLGQTGAGDPFAADTTSGPAAEEPIDIGYEPLDQE